MTVREVGPEGLGRRTALELGGRERHLRGLGPERDEYLSIRKQWAQLTNDALHRAGHAVRVDHRSLAAQGIDREPTPSIPEKVFYAERRQIEKQDPDGEARRREASRQRYHAGFRENPEAVRLRRRQYRKVHAEEINRKQREYRKANAAEINGKRREYRQERAQQAASKEPQPRDLHAERSVPSSSRVAAPLTPQDSARSWLAYREKSGPGIDAAQSAGSWKTHSQRQPTGPTAEEAARDWLAHREGRVSQETGHAPAKESSRDPQPGTTRDTDDDDERKIARRRDHDWEL